MAEKEDSIPEPSAVPVKKKLKVRESDSTSVTKPEEVKAGSRKTGSGSGKGKPKSFSTQDVAKWLLVLIAVLAPWWRGSVSALSQSLICVGLIFCAAIWLFVAIRKKELARLPIFSVTVLLFLALGIFQQWNLPQSISGFAAGKQNEIRIQLADQLEKNENQESSELRTQRQIAINRSAAYSQFAYFGLVAAVFFLSSRLFYHRDDFLILAYVFAVNGGLIAVFGLFQKVAFPNQVLGQELIFGGTPFGPFVNRNNAAGYLLLCLGCAIATLCYSFLSIKERNPALSGQSGFDREGIGYILLGEFRAIMAGLNAFRIGLLAVCGCIVTGIAVSLSRGGMIAMAAGVVALIVFLFLAKGRRAALLLILLFIPAAAVSLFSSGLQGMVAERMETLQDEDLLSNELRPILWRDSLQSLSDYTLFGSGVGSFPYVYKEYQSFEDLKWAFHAENVFIEILVTFGVLGGIFMGMGLIGAIVMSLRYPVPGPGSRGLNPKSLAVGGLVFFVLIGQSVSNFFDFGLLIPANGILMALILGAFTGVWGTKVERDQRINPSRFSQLPRIATLPVMLLVFVLVGKCSYDFYQVYQTESANLVAMTQGAENVESSEIDRTINRLENVLDRRPNLQTYQFLARLYWFRLQSEFVQYQIDQFPADRKPPQEAVWNQSTLRVLNYQLSKLPASRREVEIENLRAQEFFSTNLELCTKSHLRALVECPLSVRSIVSLAELSFLNGHEIDPYLDAFGKYNVRRTRFLIRVGDAAIAHGKKKQAIKYWRLAIQNNRQAVDSILPMADEFLSHREISYDLLPEDPALINEVAAKYYVKEDQWEAREELYGRIKRLLSKVRFDDAEANYLLAKARMETGEITRAIEAYETATDLSPFNLEWRSQLAELYFQVGRIGDALEAIQKCIDGDPNNKKFRTQANRYKE